MSERQPRRGEIWEVRPDPAGGHEQGGERPAVIVSFARLNAKPSRLAIAVPLSRRDRGNPFHVPIEPAAGGSDDRWFAPCDMVRSISHLRIHVQRGRIDDLALAAIEYRLRVLLGMR